jgi:DNA polymerase V
MLFDLTDKHNRQASLFDHAAPDPQKARDNSLMKTLDVLNNRFGRGTIHFGAEGKADAPWRIKHTRRSPQYTTAWEDLPQIGHKAQP